MKKLATTFFAAMTLMGTTASDAKAELDPFIGTIIQVGENFCPRGWMETRGQLLPIAQYSALFSLLGTTYGGDGRTTFGLPDMRGRFGMRFGHGPGLTNRIRGEKSGIPSTTQTILTLPSHSHQILGTVTATVAASSNPPDVSSPANAYKPTFPAGQPVYAETGTLDLEMGEDSVQFTHNVTLSNTGGQQPVNNMQPFLGMKSCIAIEGVYPSRS